MFGFLKKLFGSNQAAEPAVPYKIEAPQPEAVKEPAAPVKAKKARKVKTTKKTTKS